MRVMDLCRQAMEIFGRRFEGRDIGIDVPVERFVEEVRSYRPDVVGVSGPLTLALDPMKESVDAIGSAGPRERVRMMIGRAQIEQAVQVNTGADAFYKNAVDSANVCRGWMGAPA